MTDEELKALIHSYTLEPDNGKAAEMLEHIQTEFARREITLYKSEDA